MKFRFAMVVFVIAAGLFGVRTLENHAHISETESSINESRNNAKEYRASISELRNDLEILETEAESRRGTLYLETLREGSAEEEIAILRWSIAAKAAEIEELSGELFRLEEELGVK